MIGGGREGGDVKKMRIVSGRWLRKSVGEEGGKEVGREIICVDWEIKNKLVDNYMYGGEKELRGGVNLGEDLCDGWG